MLAHLLLAALTYQGAPLAQAEYPLPELKPEVSMSSPLWTQTALEGACHAADLISTEIQLRRLPDGYEANPIMRGGLAGRILAKAVTVGTTHLIRRHLLGHDRPTAAWVLTGASCAIGAGAAVLNAGR